MVKQQEANFEHWWKWKSKCEMKWDSELSADWVPMLYLVTDSNAEHFCQKLFTGNCEIKFIITFCVYSALKCFISSFFFLLLKKIINFLLLWAELCKTQKVVSASSKEKMFFSKEKKIQLKKKKKPQLTMIGGGRKTSVVGGSKQERRWGLKSRWELALIGSRWSSELFPSEMGSTRVF